jgi:hypothetical protein
MWYYYYDSNSGEFTMGSNKPYAFTDDPHIRENKRFNMETHRVNLATLEPEPKN